MKFQTLESFELPQGFRGKPGWYVQLWWIVEQLLFRPSPQFMYGWRRLLLRLFGAKVGRNVILRPTVKTQFPWKVSIGDNTWIGDDVVLYSLDQIHIGNNVVVSQKSYLCAGTHNYKEPDFPIYGLPIVVEDECWIATDVYLAPGVTVGRGSIVGARSSVFKDLPSGMVCIGSPAQPIKKRIAEESYMLKDPALV
ncbi:putative colanic acid biosynthesis acetyltransferase WcaF [Cnuella takakiae]|uniref:Putative colanic acid biosynthesis acetyltransferase WcaF n=1 Tax=Cnuella takakiae TaxID=1302690 RepID=A0A1M5E260_9BACT|nr:putative colanic acid biosynthesis acetyltransferase [Cnuella takakiae]OLY94963.1 colanic acid biosynthesis acetyltransferase WcaF [Cnuella takakiae]SHF73285.1 putative colanic acid biosynthesis acetyltransferase WcaF [Cnuella takakiae]